MSPPTRSGVQEDKLLWLKQMGFTAVSTLEFNKPEGHDHWSYRRGQREISNKLFGHDALEKHLDLLQKAQDKGKNGQVAVRFHPLLAEWHWLRESSKRERDRSVGAKKPPVRRWPIVDHVAAVPREPSSAPDL